MEELLIDRWLGGADALSVLDEASVSLVRERVRAAAGAAKLTEVEAASLVNVASELAHNQLRHGERGRIAVVPTIGRRGVEIVAADGGPGIANPTEAFKGRPSAPSGSLGVGLSAVLELSDEVDVDVRLGEGTCIRARKLAEGEPRRPCVGIFGCPIDGERVSGDDACFMRTAEALTVAVCDGLGHGVEAREASCKAVRTVAGSGGLDGLMDRANGELLRTRGAVMTLARLDWAGAVDLALVGNTAAYLCGRRETRRHAGQATVLGGRTFKRAAMEGDTLSRGERLVLFSDGLSHKVSLEQEEALLYAHPIFVAHHMMARYGTDRDDATVLVVG